MSPSPLPAAQRGVTLIEAGVVLAVIAIAACLAAPGMQQLLDARRLDGAATRLATDLRFIRSEAVARNEGLRLSVFTAGGSNCYVIHTGGTDDCRCAADGAPTCGDGAEAIKAVAFAAAEHVTLAMNVKSLGFDPLHGTVSPAGTLELSGPGGRKIDHVVNLMGRVRTCSPLGSVPGYRVCD